MIRDKYKYELVKGNKVTYVGITNNPERREKEHHRNKDFDKMRIIGRIYTKKGASEWEEKRIKTYMKYHNSNTPLYNLNEHGK